MRQAIPADAFLQAKVAELEEAVGRQKRAAEHFLARHKESVRAAEQLQASLSQARKWLAEASSTDLAPALAEPLAPTEGDDAIPSESSPVTDWIAMVLRNQRQPFSSDDFVRAIQSIRPEANRNTILFVLSREAKLGNIQRLAVGQYAPANWTNEASERPARFTRPETKKEAQ